jgi:hypothetical protein
MQSHAENNFSILDNIYTKYIEAKFDTKINDLVEVCKNYIEYIKQKNIIIDLSPDDPFDKDSFNFDNGLLSDMKKDPIMQHVAYLISLKDKLLEDYTNWVNDKSNEEKLKELINTYINLNLNSNNPLNTYFVKKNLQNLLSKYNDKINKSKLEQIFINDFKEFKDNNLEIVKEIEKSWIKWFFNRKMKEQIFFFKKYINDPNSEFTKDLDPKNEYMANEDEKIELEQKIKGIDEREELKNLLIENYYILMEEDPVSYFKKNISSLSLEDEENEVNKEIKTNIIQFKEKNNDLQIFLRYGIITVRNSN